MRLVPLCLLSLSFTFIVAAAPPPATDNSEIIVEGLRNREKQVRSFIKTMTPAPPRGQLARFEAPVCPSVRGLADDQARDLEARMRLIAAHAGIAVAKAKCAPNVFVFITNDKPGLLNQLALRPALFPEEWSQRQILKLARDPSPVTAWQTGENVWHDGVSIGSRDKSAPETNISPDTGQGSGNNVGHTFLMPHGKATRMSPSARPTFEVAVLVIKLDALRGITPTQLADYALMRALLKSDPATLKDLQSSTILNLFNDSTDGKVAQSVTIWDMSFLKAFYGSRVNMYAEYQRAQIQGAMEEELGQIQGAKQ